MSEANRGERRFDRVRCAEVSPLRGREVVEAQQHVAILPQTLARSRILGIVLGQEVIERVARCLACLGLPDIVQVALGPRLHTLREFAQYVARLVEPAALLGCLAKDFAQGGPEAECSVTHRQLRCHRQSTLLHVQEQFLPALGTLTVAVLEGDQLQPPNPGDQGIALPCRPPFETNNRNSYSNQARFRTAASHPTQTNMNEESDPQLLDGAAGRRPVSTFGNGPLRAFMKATRSFLVLISQVKFLDLVRQPFVGVPPLAYHSTTSSSVF